MAIEAVEKFYMCPRCFEATGESGRCPNCGGELVMCRPGEPDNPCRKPFMTPDGRLRAHAPVWWLEKEIHWISEAQSKP